MHRGARRRKTIGRKRYSFRVCKCSVCRILYFHGKYTRTPYQYFDQPLHTKLMSPSFAAGEHSGSGEVLLVCVIDLHAGPSAESETVDGPPGAGQGVSRCALSHRRLLHGAFAGLATVVRVIFLLLCSRCNQPVIGESQHYREQRQQCHHHPHHDIHVVREATSPQRAQDGS